MTAEIDSFQLRNILARAVGPSPWQWKTFPMLFAKDQRLTWSHHGDDGALARLVTLNADGKSDQPLLALNMYCRPFEVGPARIGVWCPEGRAIRVIAFDLDQMKPFDLAEIAGWFNQSGDRVYAATAPVAELEVSLGLQAGTHKIEVPEELQAVEEVIVPTSCPAKSNDDAAFALYVLYPHAGLLEVLPQKWFTASQYEVGKQWITKAARDPETHRIFGECFGAGNFLLEQDGCRLERWINKAS